MHFQEMTRHQDISFIQQVNDLPPFPEGILLSLAGTGTGPGCGPHHTFMHTGKEIRYKPVVALLDQQKMHGCFGLDVLGSAAAFHLLQQLPHTGNVLLGQKGKCHSQHHGFQPDASLVVFDDLTVIHGVHIGSGFFPGVDPSILFQLKKRFPDNGFGHTKLFSDGTFTDLIILSKIADQDLFSYGVRSLVMENPT